MKFKAFPLPWIIRQASAWCSRVIDQNLIFRYRSPPTIARKSKTDHIFMAGFQAVNAGRSAGAADLELLAVLVTYPAIFDG